MEVGRTNGSAGGAGTALSVHTRRPIPATLFAALLATGALARPGPQRRRACLSARIVLHEEGLTARTIIGKWHHSTRHGERTRGTAASFGEELHGIKEPLGG